MNTLPCAKCSGTGIESVPNAFDCDKDGNLTNPERDLPTMTAGAEFGEVYPCYQCNGFLITKRSHGAYKTQAAADAGLARRTGVRCGYGNAHGGFKVRTMVDHKCYACSGQGEVPIYRGGDVLDERFGRCDSMSAECSKVFAETVALHVNTKGGLSWGEANLGLDSIYTIVDYGDRWRAAQKLAQAGATVDEIVAPIKADVREHLANDRTQWIKVIDRETRAVATDLVIQLTPNGITVKACNVTQSRPVLPPTYTDAVVNGPMDRYADLTNLS